MSSQKEDQEKKVYSFTEKTKKECMTLNIAKITHFDPVYPELLKYVDPEFLNFGIWILGSKEIVEYINPNVGIQMKKQRLTELLSVISKLQSISRILVMKSDQKKLHDNLKKARTKRLKNMEMNEDEKRLADSYMNLAAASHKVMSFADKASIMQAERISFKVIDEVSKTESIASFLFKMLQHDGKLFDHISFTSLFSISVGRLMEVETEELKNISIGCMFMDIGLTNLDLPDLYTKTLKPEDQRLYERHPIVGVELLNELNAKEALIAESVFAITLQHHEKHNGYGYPNGKKGRLTINNPDGIHLFASIVNLCDRFTTYFKELEGKPVFKPKQAVLALNRLRDNFDPEVLTAFNKLVGHSEHVPFLVPAIKKGE